MPINTAHHTPVGKSSRRRDPAEVSGTFRNISLVYKFCNSLYLLIGLPRNTLYSKSNQHATAFLRQPPGYQLVAIPDCQKYRWLHHIIGCRIAIYAILQLPGRSYEYRHAVNYARRTSKVSPGFTNPPTLIPIPKSCTIMPTCSEF